MAKEADLTITIKSTEPSGNYSSNRSFKPQGYGTSRMIKLQELVYFVVDSLKKEANYTQGEVTLAFQRVTSGIDPREDPLIPQLPFPKEFSRQSLELLKANEKQVKDSLSGSQIASSKALGQMLVEGRLIVNAETTAGFLLNDYKDQKRFREVKASFEDGKEPVPDLEEKKGSWRLEEELEDELEDELEEAEVEA